MTTATDTHGDTHTDGHEAESHGLPDSSYIKIAVFLAVVTAIEVALSYTKEPLGALFLPLLLLLMGIKFFAVLYYFMHLKFDSRLFSLMFYMGLVLAVGCYIVFLTTMHFFNG